MKNNYLYQGDYSELDNDIGWYDFALRTYDAQLGRFWQSDPYDEFASPYLGMGNDPVNLVDPDGGCVTCMQTLETVVMVGQTASVGLAGIMNVLGPAMNVLGMAGNYYNLINSKISPNTLDPSSPTKTIFDPNNPQTLEGVTVKGKIKKKSWFKRNLGKVVGAVQTGLDILGSTEIPIISQIADIGSAGISFAQGDFKGAGLSLLGTVVPGASQAKLLYRSSKALKGVGKGTQLNSKTLWKGKGKERIDVENPNPSQRPGQVHYQDNKGGKYIYDPSTGKFKNAPDKINELLKNPEFKRGIEKGLKYLGY